MINELSEGEKLKSGNLADLEFHGPGQIPELLAPAGNWECAKAAVENGADAIYFGLDKFNARMRADNFTCSDLPELMEFLHYRGVRGYVTFNTLVFADELAEATRFLTHIIQSGVDAAIVQDIGICRIIRSLSPDFPIHTSTQMTITSPAGVRFAKRLGANLVVIARENSLQDIEKIQSGIQDSSPLPLETFVHGALCVAYSGQCLTSEALGGRSANRGECAQACRMTYQLVVDGKPRELGNRQYLLSPQDLAGLELIPQLAQAGIRSLKIEGRLKSPEYVAAITHAYRTALDTFASENSQHFHQWVDQSRYSLEMAFSRGLSTGWLQGNDNQKLVHARYGKKRGTHIGEVVRVDLGVIWCRLHSGVKAGDGVVFEDAESPDTESEQGGFIHYVDSKSGLTGLRFGKHGSRPLDVSRVRRGFRVWKTADPQWEKEVRSTFHGDTIRYRRPVDFAVSGELGKKLRIHIHDPWSGYTGSAESSSDLVQASERPLDESLFRLQLARLGSTPYQMRGLELTLSDNLMLPVSELNQLRRQLVTQLDDFRRKGAGWSIHPKPDIWRQWARTPVPKLESSPAQLEWSITIRDPRQLPAVIASGFSRIYCEFEDPKKYRETVREFRNLSPHGTILVAAPRIFKPGEEWILKIVKSAEPDGYLVRNFDHAEYFKCGERVGDFSLNVSNAVSADYLMQEWGLSRVTASYDLNVEQLLAFAGQWQPSRLEVCLHQRMPMFHMEHCVFCAFLSSGKDFRDCGRPCEKHQVELVDRVGEKHYLRADAGCRNTLYNSRIQTGAEHFSDLVQGGITHFRIDFLNESPQDIPVILEAYRRLAKQEISGSELWRSLKLTSQLGVTRGQFQSAEKGAWQRTS